MSEQKRFIDRFTLKPPPQARAVAEPADTRPPYMAFMAGEEMFTRLHLHRADGFVHSISYGYLSHYSFNEVTGDKCLISVGGIMFTIVGAYLHEIFQAIDNQQCAWVQAYDATRFAKPIYDYAPFVERIDVQIPLDLA